jgi:hypothetical protein
MVITSVIPDLRKLRQENFEFKTSMGYIARLCLKIILFYFFQGRKQKKVRVDQNSIRK